MLICLVLCAAAVLPTAFSERPEAQNVQPHAVRNSEIGRRLPAGFAAARNQGLLRLQKLDSGSDLGDDTIASLSDVYNALWSKNSFPDLESEDEIDQLEKRTSLDQIGGGHLLRREAILDSIGGGNLLKRVNWIRDRRPSGGLQPRQLDAIGGGHLLKRFSLDSIGGGHLLKRDALDAIGGGHLLKRDALDSIGGGHLLKRFAIDVGNLLKGDFERRQLDAIGGGHLLRRRSVTPSKGKLSFERSARNGRDFDTLLGRSFGTSKRDPRGAIPLIKRNFDEIDNAGFKDYLYKRNFDEIDSAGFKDDLYKRNFDEIDNAGFQDYLYKRNFDEIDNAGFKDYLLKRNFDEIDNAGFRDYLYKRNMAEGLPEVVCTPEGCVYKKLARY